MTVRNWCVKLQTPLKAKHIMINTVKHFAVQMKIQLMALYLASRDRRTPILAKFLILMVVAYALSPIDLIPDFIPVLGYLDDLILLPMGIYLAIRLIPKTLWQEFQEQAKKSPISLPKSHYAMLFVLICWISAIGGIAYWLWVRQSQSV